MVIKLDMNKNTDPKLMKIADACRIVKTTPQVINAHIRKGNLKSYGEGVRLVNIDEVTAIITVGKRQKTGSTKSVDLHREFGVGAGTTLYAVIETKRLVANVDRMTQQVVEVKSAYDRMLWSGIKKKAGNLISDLAAGELSSYNDIASVLKAMAKMAKGKGNMELFDDLKALHLKYEGYWKSEEASKALLPEEALIPEQEEAEDDTTDD